MSYQIIRPKEHIYTPVVLGGRILAFDSFTGADDTLLENHTPEKGGAWKNEMGSLRILSNKVKSTSNAVYTQNLGRADLTLEIDYTVDTDGAMGVAFRFVDINNYFYAYAYSNGFIYIQNVTTGADTNMVNANVGHSVGDYLRLKVVLAGNNFTFSVSGDHTGSINTSSASRNTAAIHGLKSYNFTPFDGRLDNYIAAR